jgi:hypothetical protein
MLLLVLEQTIKYALWRIMVRKQTVALMFILTVIAEQILAMCVSLMMMALRF